MNYLSWKSS